MKTRFDGWSFLAALLFLSLCPSLLPADDLIPTGAVWRYLKGTAQPPADWNTRGFTDTGWAEGPAGIGYGDGDDATVLDDMLGNYVTIYTRRSFPVDNPASVQTLVLRISYDDGFVAYLNGVEVLRRSMGADGSPVAFDTLASDHEAQGFEAFDLTSKIPLLTTGANLLAVEVHNRDLMSSDLSFHPNLQANVPVTGGPLPPGFVTDTLAGGFSSPVAVAFAD